ncbi:hypothetical protein HNO90_001906 [Staphylococcus hominis]|uniref:hypothetical protein n=1 Tax=Staphylococcus hominis TaxID=1290 RepID=UPI00160C9160|nr:hypothetical protein [Staphylococcus hominis]MBB4833470.1 hypothetical protein [Staphylococcus hominis]MCI2871933.1 hypothetical protein [Staphylococcus hominis]MCI2876213.1 hypothetical protein [Staphylococcus hominis]MCI2890583.1 hypothetical protein [Staphylococcus hominis]MDS3867588.1 hypothetical protein [Staphylococcus hominis]
MTIEDKQTKSQTKDKHNIEETKSSQEYDNSIGYNGEKKTALDLEIERELLEMMENKDPEPEKEKKSIKIAGLLSALVIAILAIVRFIHRTL